MDGEEFVESDVFLELLGGFFVAGGGPELVAGGEGMAGIEADTDAPVGDFPDKLSQLFKGIAEIRALPGGGFQSYSDGIAAGLLDQFFDGDRDSF